MDKKKRFEMIRSEIQIIIAAGIVVLLLSEMAIAADTARAKGIDVSGYQHPDNKPIDWEKVHNAGKTFAWVKASEGVGYTNKFFKEDTDKGTVAGLKMGAYHFARPYWYTPEDEAQKFIDATKNYLKDGYLRPALDIENLDINHNPCTKEVVGANSVSDWINKWMNIIKTQTGVEPVIYTNLYGAGTCLDASITIYDLWIAKPTNSLNPDIDSPNTGIWENWAFWQYSSTGKVDGIGDGTTTNVDMDVFNGPESDLSKFVIKNSKFSSKLDLVFLIDTTGSMSDDIDQVKLSANEIINTLDSKGLDWRVAIADYKDYPCCGYGGYRDYVYKLDLPFTAKDSKPAIVTAINGLGASGGADWRESVYSAFYNAMTDVNKDSTKADNYGWRKGASKAIIVMADAPPHIPEPWSGGHTLEEIVSKSKEIDPILVYSIAVGSDPTTYEAFAEISESTGGKVYTSPTASDVVDAIIEAIGDIGETTTNRGVSVNVTPALNETSPGNSATYSVNITNEGNTKDTYNILLDLKNFAGSYRAYPVAIQPSWITFNNASVELEPAISEIRSLEINVPSNWAGMEDVIYSFSVTAKSETDEAISNTSSAELKVKANKKSMVEYSKLEAIWLSELIRSSSINQDIKNSLLDKLSNVTLKLDQGLLNIESGKYKQANNMLDASQNIINAFINQVEAQYDKKIMQPDAIVLKEKANQILQDIEKAKNI